MQGSRYFTMSYDINVTSLRNCPFVNGGQFCAMKVSATLAVLYLHLVC
jgi:hypothetical protein